MKVLNVFGIILAWILSIALVVMLIAAPLLLSALSVLEPENIIDVVTEGLTESQESAAADLQQEYVLEKVSVTSQQTALAQKVLEALDLKEIETIVGEKIDAEVVAKVMTSDAATEIFEVYAKDVANALTGGSGNAQFTAQKLEKIVHDNMDEIVEAIEEAGVTLSESQKQKLKSEIVKAVQKNADKIIGLFPAPEKIAETIVEDSQMGGVVAMFLEGKKMVKTAIIGIIALLAVLIALLRYPGFRGLRWLATDLFVAGGINVVFCLVLKLGSSAIKGLAAGVDSAVLDGIAGEFLGQLTAGVISRTAIMVVAAAVLLVVYCLLKNLVQNRKANVTETYYDEELMYDPDTTEFVPEVTEEYTWDEAEPAAPTENEN